MCSDELDEMGASAEDMSIRAAQEGVARGFEVPTPLEAEAIAGNRYDVELVEDEACESVTSEADVGDVVKAPGSGATNQVATLVGAGVIDPGGETHAVRSADAMAVLTAGRVVERASRVASGLVLGAHASRPVDVAERRKVRREGRQEQLGRMRIYEAAVKHRSAPSLGSVAVGSTRRSSSVRLDVTDSAPVRAQRRHVKSAVAVAPVEASSFCLEQDEAQASSGAESAVDGVEKRFDSIAPEPPTCSPAQVQMGMSRRLSILILFSGRSRPGDLPSALRSRGHDVETFELLDGDEQDLSAIAMQEAVVARVAGGEFDAVFLAPPCSSFSIAIEEVLRTVREPEGVSVLSEGWRKYVHEHNKLAWFATRVCFAAEAAGVAWAIENPAARDAGVARWAEFEERGSMWHLKAVRELVTASKAVRVTFAHNANSRRLGRSTRACW